MKTFFDNFSQEQIKSQYKENYKSLVRMQAKAEQTNKKVNGYTLQQLNSLVNKYKVLSDSK